MTTKILLPLAALAMLTLAACSNPENADAPETAAPAAAPAAEVAPAAAPAATAPAAAAAAPAAAAMTPADAAAMTPEQAMQAVQAQAATMTEEQKTETIAQARKAAEDMGKAQGLTDDQIKQAGDMAEQATKQMLGVQ